MLLETYESMGGWFVVDGALWLAVASRKLSPPPGSSKTAGGGTNQIFSRSIIVLLPTLRVNLISTPIRTSSIFRLSKLVSESGKELNDGCEFSKCGDGQPKKEKRDTDLK